MGIMKFLARKGAVGGTARIVGKQYKKFRQIHPNKDEIEDSEIYQLIIKDRFKVLSNKTQEDNLLKKANEMSGLVELIREILGVEAGYYENTYQNQLMFESIIAEELQKIGINHEN
jgi:cell fate regulator YaaT (PSP1 superfamily)